MPDEIEAASPPLSRSLMNAGQLTRERIFSFGVVYLAIFAFLLLYIFTIRVAESRLDEHFDRVANEALLVTQLDLPVALQIQQSIHDAIDKSWWVRVGGVQVNTLVLAADGVTWIYVQGRIVPQPTELGPTDVLREAVEMLPATASVTATVPHNALLANGILVVYGSILLQGLYLYFRTTTRRQSDLMSQALGHRDEAARRAASIEAELEQTRLRLAEVEPAEREHSAEIATLHTERRDLQRRLSALATREEELLGKADRAVELSQEVRALEDLLDEAGSDLESKDAEIRELESNLKRAGTHQSNSSRARGAELMARRLRTLYKALEIDDRAIDDLVALRDESMKLKAEEKLKRLADEADNVTVRRKVGGLPEHLSIFELGFAGKGRIYYTKGKQRRFRILSIGAKNSQDADLEYLRRHGHD